MPTKIEAVATTRPRRRNRGALQLSELAAVDCLARAGREPADVELFINTGIFHERNMGEPAFASLMQDDIAANPRPGGLRRHGTFSFDLANSTGGVLHAIHVTDGFLASGAISLGMVVAGDNDPRPGHPAGLIPSRGGALLLSHHPTVGFARFAFEDFPEDAGLRTARVAWTPDEHRRWRRHAGSNTLTITTSDDFAEHCAIRTGAVLERLAQQSSIPLSGVDLIIASHTSADFADLLSAELGFARSKIVSPDGPDGGAHSAGLLIAADRAMRDGAFRPGARILFAAAGAGITVGAALYRA